MEDKETRKPYKQEVKESVLREVENIMQKLQEIMRYHPSEALQDANFKLAEFKDNDAESLTD